MDDQTRIPPPNYTQIPNAIFDLMADENAKMTEAELRVILAIARKTFGWHKKRDKLSLTQLEKLTAMSRPSVKAGIDAAIARGMVRRTPDRDDKRGGFFYELLVDELNEQTSKEFELVKKVNQLNELTRTSKEFELELVKNLNTQKKEKESKESGRGETREPAHPAITLYSKLTGIQPAKYSIDMIAEQVADLNRWEKVIKEWLASGFKPGNVKGMLDWYHGKGKHQQNGAFERVAPTVGLQNRSTAPPDARPPQESAKRMLALREKQKNDATP